MVLFPTQMAFYVPDGIPAPSCLLGAQMAFIPAGWLFGVACMAFFTPAPRPGWLFVIIFGNGKIFQSIYFQSNNSGGGGRGE